MMYIYIITQAIIMTYRCDPTTLQYSALRTVYYLRKYFELIYENYHHHKKTTT